MCVCVYKCVWVCTCVCGRSSVTGSKKVRDGSSLAADVASDRRRRPAGNLCGGGGGGVRRLRSAYENRLNDRVAIRRSGALRYLHFRRRSTPARPAPLRPVAHPVDGARPPPTPSSAATRLRRPSARLPADERSRAAHASRPSSRPQSRSSSSSTAASPAHLWNTTADGTLLRRGAAPALDRSRSLRRRRAGASETPEDADDSWWFSAANSGRQTAGRRRRRRSWRGSEGKRTAGGSRGLGTFSNRRRACAGRRAVPGGAACCTRCMRRRRGRRTGERVASAEIHGDVDLSSIADGVTTRRVDLSSIADGTSRRIPPPPARPGRRMPYCRSDFPAPVVRFGTGFNDS